MVDTITVINFNKKASDIGNFYRLPEKIKNEIQDANQIVVRGFQELYGLDKDRVMSWSLGGYWTSHSKDAKFIGENYGSKKTQWDGRVLRKACKHCGGFND
jgi:hypothetical protein